MENKLCLSPVCDRVVYARGLCSGHYARSLKGDPRLDVPIQVRGSARPLCVVPFCARYGVGQLGYCRAHAERIRRTGEPGPAEIQPRRGVRLKEERRYTDPRTGYVYLSGPGFDRDLEHRIVMERLIGRELRPDEHVHHKNGKRSDNREENLELWSTHHPKGQRIEDLLQYAHEIIERYENG